MAMMKPAFEGENIDYPKAHKQALYERVVNNPHTLIDADVARYLSDRTIDLVIELVLTDLIQDEFLVEIHEILTKHNEETPRWTESGIPLNPNSKHICDKLSKLGYVFVADNGKYVYEGDLLEILNYMLDDGMFDNTRDLRRHKDRIKRGIVGRWNNSVGLIREAGFEVRLEK